MAKFRKKPVVIEAVLWTGDNLDEIREFMGRPAHECHPAKDESVLLILTLEGTMSAQKGDWIVKGVKGEHYPCKPDIFAETYEEVPE